MNVPPAYRDLFRLYTDARSHFEAWAKALTTLRKALAILPPPAAPLIRR